MSVRAGVAVVVLLCALNAAGVLYASGVVADATTGSVQIDNPARPSETICEDAQSPGDFFYEYHHETCATEPATVQQPLASYAADAASDLAFAAFLVPFAVWIVVSGLLHVVIGGATADDYDDRVRFSAVLAVTAVGLAPTALRYLARPLVVELETATLTPAGIDAARALAADALTPSSSVWLAVVAATAAWSALVWWQSWQAAFDVSSRRAGTIAGVAGACFLLSALAPVLVGGGAGVVGVLLVALGIPALAFPRDLERIDLAFDLIGTRGGENVEPKPWRVALQQVSGLALVAVGTVLLGGLALA
ncbi:hypothetical protein GCM10009019_20930 [Salarchaeum japonicum]|uniref:DUF6199 domain-containing protein n=1 Tax=Salarchaeum japonicum TaxID=555573 RepID=A0AAV3T3W1_9EURY